MKEKVENFTEPVISSMEGAWIKTPTWKPEMKSGDWDSLNTGSYVNDTCINIFSCGLRQYRNKMRNNSISFCSTYLFHELMVGSLSNIKHFIQPYHDGEQMEVKITGIPRIGHPGHSNIL